jgi:hypothetical protein
MMSRIRAGTESYNQRYGPRVSGSVPKRHGSVTLHQRESQTVSDALPIVLSIPVGALCELRFQKEVFEIIFDISDESLSSVVDPDPGPYVFGPPGHPDPLVKSTDPTPAQVLP